MPRDQNLYIDDMIKAIEAIQEYTRGFNEISFTKDKKTKDACIRNLEIIGEAAKKVDAKIKNEFQTIEWRKIAALRDILIHEYFGVDDEILWDVIVNKLPELKDNLQKFFT